MVLVDTPIIQIKAPEREQLFHPRTVERNGTVNSSSFQIRLKQNGETVPFLILMAKQLKKKKKSLFSLKCLHLMNQM